MVRIAKPSKAISTIFIAFIMSAVVLAVFTYIFMNTASTMLSNAVALGNVARYSHQHELAQLIANRSRNEVRLINVGPSDVVIDKVIVRTLEGALEVKNVTDVCPDNPQIIATNGFITCSLDYEYVAAVTLDGAVIYIQTPLHRAYVVKANTTYIVPITFLVKNPAELGERFGVPIELIAKPYTRDRATVSFTGMTSAQHVLLLPPGQEAEFENASVETDADGLAFGVAVIGYDPSWVIEKMRRPSEDIPPRLSIMIAGPGFEGEQIRIGGRTFTLSGNGFRILINNFTGVVQIRRGTGRGASIIACSSTVSGGCPSGALPAIGFWYYGATDQDLNLRIYISGIGGYIARFMRIASANSPTGRTSYYPYLFIGDVDGNGLNDIVFITEDAYYGSSDRTNDRYGNDLSDWSTEPLVLKLLEIGYALGSRDGTIDGKTYAGIALYMNIFFHDNSHPDEDQLRDNDRTDWVLRILLIDSTTGAEYIVREYRYQEICNYHKTRVTDFGRDNYFVKISQSIYVSIPATGSYWIAIAFQDSYGSGRTNDVDFTVGIEFIGAIPFYR